MLYTFQTNPHTLVNDEVEDPAASMFRMRPINRNVGSDSAFKTARDWLDECGNHVDDSHQLCPLVKDIVFTPTRLLEICKVGREYSAHLRTTNGDSIRYACLSYCWGGDQPVKTTKATIVSRHIGITFSTLPQTLQEAIISSFKIGVSHIWIDCLCIVQDDKEDLAAELIKMPEIYKNAYVTISASSASNCREGFLSPRYPSTEDLTLQYECPDGQIGNIYMFEERIGNKDDPIRTRAWCLQERILSPRLLDFSSQQLQWKCNSLNRFDGGYASYTQNNLLGRVHTDDVKHAIMEIWSENVDQYAKCSLSFPADKLVAIGAMASHIGDALKMTYLAGLWREVLPEQLLWHNRNEPAARLQEYRAPSWSWASIDAPVVFRRYWMSYPDMGRFTIEILETSVQLLSAEHLYGPVLSAKLVLEGRLVKALWYVNRRDCIAVDTRPLAVLPRFRKEIGRVANKFFGWNSQSNIDKSSTPENTEYEEVTIGMSVDALESDWDFEDPDFAVEAHCLLVKSHSESGSAEGIILIRARSGQEDHYTRAGLFWFFKDGVLPDLFRLAKDRIITIL